MGEPATALLDRWEPSDEPTPSGGLGRRYAVAGLIGALVATVAATAFMVLSQPDSGPSAASRPSASASAVPDPLPSTPPVPRIPTAGYAGITVADAVPRLEAAGAEVDVFDARAWDRPVGPDWTVCTVGELFYVDTPSGFVQIAAVPVGDPCP
jgi:hypothetical protein